MELMSQCFAGYYFKPPISKGFNASFCFFKRHVSGRANNSNGISRFQIWWYFDHVSFNKKIQQLSNTFQDCPFFLNAQLMLYSALQCIIFFYMPYRKIKADRVMVFLYFFHHHIINCFAKFFSGIVRLYPE